MCRSIVRFFIAFLIIFFSFLVVFLWTIKFQLLDSPYYKNFLRKNDVYNTVLETGKAYFTGKESEEGVIIAQPAIDILFEKILTPKILQDVTEINLDNTFGFLNGRKERFVFYFPKEYILEKLDLQTIDNFENEVNSIIKSLPTCTPQQLAELEGGEVSLTSKIECLPPDFQYEDIDLSEMLEQIQDYTGKNPLEEYLNTFLPQGSSPNEVDVATFIKNSPREPGAPDPEVFFQSVQMYYSYFQWSLVGLSLFTALLIFLFILLGGKDAWLKSTGQVVIIIGIPLLISSTSLLLLARYYETRLFGQFFTGIPEEYREFLNFLPGLAVKFLTGVFLPVVIISISLIFIGIVMLVIKKFASKAE